MKKLLLFILSLTLSLAVVAFMTIYVSPTDGEGKLIPFLISIYLVLTSLTTFSFFTIVFYFLHQLFERLIKKKPWSDQKMFQRRFLLTSMRRALIMSLVIVSMLAIKIFKIDTQLNVLLILLIGGLSEVLLWRFRN